MVGQKCLVCYRTTSLNIYYGVLTCYDCSIFYKECYTGSLPTQPCRYEQKCRIWYKENFCLHCRLRKCVALGMMIPDSPPATGIEDVKTTLGKDEFDLFLTLNSDLSMICSILKAQRSTYDEDRFREILDNEPTRHVISNLCCPFNLEPHLMPTDDIEALRARFDQSVTGVGKFANGIPGFCELLTLVDQRVLLRNGLFQVLFLRLSPLFQEPAGVRCMSGHVIRSNVGYDVDYLQRMFEVADRLYYFGLSQTEMAYFSAVLLLNDRLPELTNRNMVSFLREKVKCYLCMLNNRTKREIKDLLSMINDLDYLATGHKQCCYKKPILSRPDNEPINFSIRAPVERDHRSPGDSRNQEADSTSQGFISDQFPILFNYLNRGESSDRESADSLEIIGIKSPASTASSNTP